MASFSDPAEREALALGSYYPNHFLLRFGVSAPFLRMEQSAEGGEAPGYDQSFVSVFWHEYVHYWHNVSTVSGFKSLFSSHHVLGAVSQAVVRGGEYRDVLNRLTTDEKDHLAGVVQLDSHLNGEARPNGVDVDARLERIQDYRIETGTVELRDGPASDPRAVLTVEVRSPNGTRSCHPYILGSLAIEEAAAVLAQDVVDQEEHTAHSLYVPDFPYRVLERLFESIVGTDFTPFNCFAVATIALMRAHPGPGLIEALERVRDLVRGGASVDEAVDIVAHERAPGVAGVLDDITGKALPELVAAHEGRSLLHDAILEYQETFARAAALRRQDLIFDAREFFSGNVVTTVNRQMTAFPPCDMLQHRQAKDGVFPRDLLVAPDIREASPFRAFQAQQHLAYYLTRENSRYDVQPTCPVFFACNLKYRVNCEERCRTAPWEWADQSPTCWYGIAAAGLRGKLQASTIK